MAPHIGVAKVPEPRIIALTDMLHPKKVVPAEIRYLDMGASVKGAASDQTIGGQLLAQLSNVDVLINVVRAFTDESIPHIEDKGVEQDIVAMDLELAFSDLTIIERRQERIALSLKGAKQSERQGLVHEQEMLTEIKAELEMETPIREMQLTPGETRIISNFQFLSAKPLLIVVNIGEDQLPQAAELEAELNQRYSRPNRLVLALCEQASDSQKRRAVDLAQVNVQWAPQQVRSQAHASLGWSLYQLGRLEDAQEALGRAVQSGSVNADTAYYLARISVKRGNIDEAVDMLKKALESTAPFYKRQDAQSLLNELTK